ncbi:MAG: DUF86 domain-containing protein [Peptococcaceae bacterium]|jgi:uncharacterized protein YutE (UPF0331/DUF86 family)|nr:DUF86 domain-containing protein [Peptococcaceae bacterium]
MDKDVLLNKTAIIERCIKRINEEYNNDPSSLNNITKQDSIILNIQRACEASIDLAMHVIAEKGLGIPQYSRDAFDMLASEHIIEKDLANILKAMVGFRNIAVHNYQELKLSVVKQIIEHNLKDLLHFSRVLIQAYLN